MKMAGTIVSPDKMCNCHFRIRGRRSESLNDTVRILYGGSVISSRVMNMKHARRQNRGAANVGEAQCFTKLGISQCALTVLLFPTLPRATPGSTGPRPEIAVPLAPTFDDKCLQALDSLPCFFLAWVALRLVFGAYHFDSDKFQAML